MKIKLYRKRESTDDEEHRYKHTSRLLSIPVPANNKPVHFHLPKNTISFGIGGKELPGDPGRTKSQNNKTAGTTITNGTRAHQASEREPQITWAESNDKSN